MYKTNAGKKKLCSRILVLLLILIMMAGEASAAVTGISAQSIYSKKVNVYVRAFVPGSKSPWNSIGHFDLMIEGVITFRGKTFKNPVFSYRSQDSCLAVFNETDTGKYYAHSSPSDYYYDCDLYQAKLATADYNTVKAFLKQLNNNISSVTKYSGGVKCKFKSSSEFSKYRVTSTNCFYAVAVWMKGFGNDSLLNYYYKAHSGKEDIYLPKTIVRAFDGKFKLKYNG